MARTVLEPAATCRRSPHTVRVRIGSRVRIHDRTAPGPPPACPICSLAPPPPPPACALHPAPQTWAAPCWLLPLRGSSGPVCSLPLGRSWAARTPPTAAAAPAATPPASPPRPPQRARTAPLPGGEGGGDFRHEGFVVLSSRWLWLRGPRGCWWQRCCIGACALGGHGECGGGAGPRSTV